MKSLTRWWPLLLLGLAGLAVILLAAGLPQLEFRPGGAFPSWIFDEFQPEEVAEETPSALATPPSNFWQTVILVIIWGILILWVITFILVPQARKRMLLRMVNYIIILLILYYLLDNLRPLGSLTENEEAASDIGEQWVGLEPPPIPPGFIDNPPQWLVILITAIFMALILGLVWLVWRLRPRFLPRLEPSELLALEAKQALKTLQTGSDLKNTVLRCYQEMSRVLSQQRGIRRQSAMTPREFEQHLTDIGLRDDHIKRLTRLFENVRYGDYTSSEREKREAVDCLNAIVRTYGRSA
ncbi:MAG: DUF4129 domain-containing protein [Anaerolineae bacterium]|nr:DUF4129 domain-containing protein [Anaerolineae bacterium]